MRIPFLFFSFLFYTLITHTSEKPQKEKIDRSDEKIGLFSGEKKSWGDLIKKRLQEWKESRRSREQYEQIK